MNFDPSWGSPEAHLILEELQQKQYLTSVLLSSSLQPLELEQFGPNFIAAVYRYLGGITLADWPGIDHQGSP